MSRKMDPSIRLMVSDAHDEAPTTDALADLSARYADLEEERAAARAGASRDAALLAEHRAQAAEDLATIEALRAEARAGREKYALQQAEHVRALATVRAVVHSDGDAGAALVGALAERDEAHAKALAAQARANEERSRTELAGLRSALLAEREARRRVVP
mgnify:FL=1